MVEEDEHVLDGVERLAWARLEYGADVKPVEQADEHERVVDLPQHLRHLVTRACGGARGREGRCGRRVKEQALWLDQMRANAKANEPGAARSPGKGQYEDTLG